MLGDKRFDIDMDSMIVDRVKYKSTGLYELIFKRIPDATFLCLFYFYIEDDKQTYKNILLTTNAHRLHDILMFIMDNKEHKYKYIIGPLVLLIKLVEEKMQA